MLVLSRKIEESVVFTGPGTVKFLGLYRGGIRLGFEGPAETGFVRKELIE